METVNNFDTIYIYVPSAKQIIAISEGSGDNLDDSDLEAGYVDYIYYEVHELAYGIHELDGGMIMLTKPLQEEFKSMKDTVPYVLEMAYDMPDVPYIVLD